MGLSFNSFDYFVEGFKAAFSFIHAAQASSKILWRNGYLNCPTDCADGTSTCMSNDIGLYRDDADRVGLGLGLESLS